MFKKVLILMTISFLLLGALTVNAADEVKKEVPKKAVKKYNKGFKIYNEGVKEQDAEKKAELFNKSLELYNEAIKIAPDYAEAYYQLALVNYNLKKSDLVLSNLKKTLSLDKNHQDAQVFLAKYYIEKGNMYRKKRDFKKMIESFENFINLPISKTKLAKQYSSTLYMLGITYSGIKQYKKGNEYLLKFVDINKTAPKSQPFSYSVYLIGYNMFQILDNELSEKNIKKDADKVAETAKKYGDIEKYLNATILEPVAQWTEDAYFTLGNYYYYKKDKANAKKIYEKLIETFPQSKNLETYKKFLSGAIEKMK